MARNRRLAGQGWGAHHRRLDPVTWFDQPFVASQGSLRRGFVESSIVALHTWLRWNPRLCRTPWYLLGMHPAEASNVWEWPPRCLVEAWSVSVECSSLSSGRPLICWKQPHVELERLEPVHQLWLTTLEFSEVELPWLSPWQLYLESQPLT